MQAKVKRIVSPICAAVLAVVASGSLSVAAAPALDDVEMQALLNSNGSGRLFVNTAGEGWSWEVCTPNLARCRSFKHGRGITTAGARPNSVFRVTGNAGVGVSPLWTGRVKSLTPPTVRGAVRVNELVVPVRGQWSGGWEGEDSDTLQLAACDTPDGRGCTTLTHSHYPRGCRNEAAVLDPVFVGDYLRVADRRRGAGPIREFAYAVGSPYGWEVLRRNRITSVAFVGRIAAATGPRSKQCGPPPLAEKPS